MMLGHPLEPELNATALGRAAHRACSYFTTPSHARWRRSAPVRARALTPRPRSRRTWLPVQPSPTPRKRQHRERLALLRKQFTAALAHNWRAVRLSRHMRPPQGRRASCWASSHRRALLSN